MIDSELRMALRKAASYDRLLVASDYDGTLSPIVDDPAAAIPHPRARGLLLALAARPGVHVAVVSGRPVALLKAFLGAAPGITLIGNHGARSDGIGDRSAVESLTRELRSVADRFDGSHVEPKPLGAAFHYRHATDKDGAKRAALSVAERYDAMIVEGKEVVEAIKGRGDKGSAIVDLQQETGTEVVVFFGDDVTDEAAFRRLSEPSVTVKVGHGPTAARHRTSDPDDVADALSYLLDILD